MHLIKLFVSYYPDEDNDGVLEIQLKPSDIRCIIGPYLYFKMTAGDKMVYLEMSPKDALMLWKTGVQRERAYRDKEIVKQPPWDLMKYA